VKLLKNFLSLAAAEALSKVVTFAAFAYLARVAGPEGFGIIEFAGSLMLCAALVVDQGFGPYGAREIAKDPRRTQALVAEIVAARFMLAIGAYAAVVAFAIWGDPSPVVTRLLLVYGLSLFVMPLLLQWVFQGHDQMQVVGAAQLIRQVVFVAVVFALIRDYDQIWFVAVAELAGVSIAALFGLWMYRRMVTGRLEVRPKITGNLFRQGVPIGLSQMFWVVKMYGATVILSAIAATEDVGFFAASMRILLALHTFVYLYHFNLLPSLARAWREADGSYAALIDRSMRTVTWLGAAAALVWVFVAPQVVTAVYGERFEPAGSTLQWLAGVCVVAWLSGHYRFGLIAAGQQTAEMITAAAGAVVAAILIPVGYKENGPEGAAMALVAAEIVVWAGSWWFSRRRLAIDHHARLLVRPLVAVAVTIGLLWPLSTYSWAARAVAALGAITALAFLLDPAVRNHLRKLRAARRAGQLLSKELPEVTR
jgi:PST family polysaccharide transporter